MKECLIAFKREFDLSQISKFYITSNFFDTKDIVELYVKVWFKMLTNIKHDVTYIIKNVL